MHNRWLRWNVVILGAVFTACAPEPDETRLSAASAIALISEVYETARDTTDNIDSAAIWHGPAGQHWLLATAKETDVIVVSDATTGATLKRVGGSGTMAGQLDRPNGIAVLDDLLWIVERDNARVQVFTLPDLQSIGIYGAAELRKPYGIAVVQEGKGVYSTYITDNYEFVPDSIPADSLLGQRVRHFRVQVRDRKIVPALANTFGATRGQGVLQVVESIAADPAHDRLLIAEERVGRSMVKVYTLGGQFTGQVIDSTFFPAQAEGIALYACPDDTGYWIATDQSLQENTFHVFDRTSLAHIGSFRGRGVLNTDGITLTQVPFGSFDAGAFIAIHNDGNAAAFQWRDIAAALRLRFDCTQQR